MRRHKPRLWPAAALWLDSGAQLRSRRMFATSAAIFSFVLVITGVAKMARPHDVEKALIALGLPRLPYVGVALGVGEVAIGVAALFVTFGLVVQGLLYLVFAGWVAVALHRNIPLASCGCLGRDDTPPTMSHVVLNVLAAAVSLGALFGESVVLGSGLELIAQIVVVGGGVFLSFIVLTDLARLSGIRAR